MAGIWVVMAEGEGAVRLALVGMSFCQFCQYGGSDGGIALD